MINKKILIVGSKGFIGTYCYNFFSNLNSYSCWGCDVVVDYEDANYLQLDASNSDFFEIFEKIDFDVCVNCSGAASVPDSIKHPFRDYSLNTLNVIKLLEAIRRYSINCKFINISSAAVYGNPAHLPIKETEVINPVSPYGRHKHYAEDLCKEYYDFFGINTCSLRIFSAYGPGLKKQLLWDVYQKSIKDRSITLFGTGNETRDYIFITDIIDAIYIIVEKASFNSSVYNIANGIEISTYTIVTELLKCLDYRGDVNFNKETRKGDPINWKADIEKIKDIGYVSNVSIAQGINYYVKWLNESKLH